MRDYITLGSAPAEEDCVQVSRSTDYFPAMKAECQRFKTYLERLYPNPPGEAYFGIKTFPHDFGSYCEVVVYYNPESDEECDFAFELEGNTPSNWDEQA